MKNEFIGIGEYDLQVVADTLLKLNSSNRIFALYGEMGAGKTTFIRYLCQHIGVVDAISSPTYGLIHSYSSPTNGLVHHFDCYRLKNIREIQEIGFSEYLYSGQYCFIEWPELIESLLPPETVRIFIKCDLNPQLRTITFS